jgi:hypothetical protein
MGATEGKLVGRHFFGHFMDLDAPLKLSFQSLFSEDIAADTFVTMVTDRQADRLATSPPEIRRSP